MGFSVTIKYKNHKGSLDPLTGNVKFYGITYPSINNAINGKQKLR